MNNFEKAIEYYRKCLKINPINGGACLSLGIAYTVKTQYDEALFWLNKS